MKEYNQSDKISIENQNPAYSSLAIEVDGGKHVHYVKGVTDLEDGHKHKFQAASLIENPLAFEKCE